MPLPPALRSRLTPTDLQRGCRRRCTAPFRQLCVFVVHTETMTAPCTLHSTAPPVAAALHCYILAAIFFVFCMPMLLAGWADLPPPGCILAVHFAIHVLKKQGQL